MQRAAAVAAAVVAVVAVAAAVVVVAGVVVAAADADAGVVPDAVAVGVVVAAADADAGVVSDAVDVAAADVVVAALDVAAGVVAITGAAGGTPVVTSGAASGFLWRGRGATSRGAAGACTALVIRIERSRDGRGGPQPPPAPASRRGFVWLASHCHRERPLAQFGGQVALPWALPTSEFEVIFVSRGESEVLEFAVVSAVGLEPTTP